MVVSVFVSETVTKKTRYNKCQDAVNSGEISCFVEPRYNHINCSEDSSFQKTDIACFQFLLIGVSSDPVQAIVEAVFLYIGCDKFLTALFHLIKGLLSLKKTICWAVIVLATGVALILMQFIQFAIAFSLTSDLDLLNMIKYFVLNCNILLAGILLLIGSPMEKIDTNLKEQNNELHLISFSDADTVI